MHKQFIWAQYNWISKQSLYATHSKWYGMILELFFFSITHKFYNSNNPKRVFVSNARQPMTDEQMLYRSQRIVNMNWIVVTNVMNTPENHRHKMPDTAISSWGNVGTSLRFYTAFRSMVNFSCLILYSMRIIHFQFVKSRLLGRQSCVVDVCAYSPLYAHSPT